MWYKIIKTGSNSGLLRESVGWEVRRGPTARRGGSG